MFRLTCLERLSSPPEVPDAPCGSSPPPLRPSWEHLFSETLFVADLLQEIEAYYGYFSNVDRLPVHERADACRQNMTVLGYLPYNSYMESVYRRDAQCQLRWLLMRIATAIAWYEMDNSRFPAKLDDLVPKYIVNISPCPLTGKPFGYREGTVWSFGPDGDDDNGTNDIFGELETDPAKNGDAVWTVSRKK